MYAPWLPRTRRAANGREKNHGIVEVIVYVVLVSSVSGLNNIVSKAIAGAARAYGLNPDVERGSSHYDAGIDLTIAQIIAVSDVNEAIAVAINHVEHIMSL